MIYLKLLKYIVTGGHNAMQCYKLKRNLCKSPQSTANVVQISTPPSEWLFDSEASHHIINGLNNLFIKNDNTCSNQLHVANSNKLHISHFRCIIIPTNRKPLKLLNVLRVLEVTQNLVSVSQLCESNNVSIEFFFLGILR